jgi:UDP-glucuronate 4-epimerase
MTTHYLVTGGAGFIGSNLVDRLLADGHAVTVLDNFDPLYDRGRKLANLVQAARSPGFRLIEGDITDSEAVARAWADGPPDVVLHLAARAGVRPSIEDPVGYGRVNVEGTLRLLEQAKQFPATRFVFASSSSVYGDRAEGPFRETDRVDDPISPYAATKKAGELLCHTYHHLYGLPVTCLRFFTVYGPRNRPDLAIAKFMRLIDDEQPVPLYGDGSSRRDYTYIEDIVEGVVRAAQGCRDYAIYNLGNAHPVELSQLVELIGQALGKTPRLEWMAPQPGDVRQTFADVSRAAHDLGFVPKTSLPEGLRRYADWFRRERTEQRLIPEPRWQPGWPPGKVPAGT